MSKASKEESTCGNVKMNKISPVGDVVIKFNNTLPNFDALKLLNDIIGLNLMITTELSQGVMLGIP